MNKETNNLFLLSNAIDLHISNLLSINPENLSLLKHTFHCTNTICPINDCNILKKTIKEHIFCELKNCERCEKLSILYDKYYDNKQFTLKRKSSIKERKKYLKDI